MMGNFKAETAFTCGELNLLIFGNIYHYAAAETGSRFEQKMTLNKKSLHRTNRRAPMSIPFET